MSVDEETSITLVAVELDASARIEPTPAGALVAVDGVSVGRGVWEGGLRSGSHRVEATAEGFVPATRTVFLRERGRELIPLALERDPLSPLWGRRSRGHFALELNGSFAIAPTFGGQVSATCNASCTSTAPHGALALVRVAYQLPQGLGAGVEGGALGIGQFIDRRGAQIVGPALLATDNGIANDVLTMNGLLLGGSLFYRRGEAWAVTLRLAVGAYLSTVTDVRNGRFITSAETRSEPYAVGALESHAATYLYVAPEVRLGRRFGDHWEISAGVQVTGLVIPHAPAWSDQTLVLRGAPR